MIRIQHKSLPAGLSAVVRRQPSGGIDVVVSTVIGPAQQRAAVRAGLRATRRAGLRTVLPVPLLGVVALAWASARAIARSIRVHPAALVTAAGLVTAAAVVVAVVPNQHATTGGGHPAAGGVPAPASTSAHPAGRPARSTQPGAGPHSTSSPPPSVVPVADPSPASGGGGSAPGPGPSAVSPTAPAPQPSPSRSSGNGGGLCVDLLGIWVCV